MSKASPVTSRRHGAVRFAPLLVFLQARLSPQSYLGLQLTTGALILIGASWLFGGVAEDVVYGYPLTLIDMQLAQWFHTHSTPYLTEIMLAIKHLHDPIHVPVAVTLLAGYLAAKRNWYWLVCLSLTVPFGMLLNVLMKVSFHRIRPGFDTPILIVARYSFPSGHMVGATLLLDCRAAGIRDGGAGCAYLPVSGRALPE
jgi:hypothetical protein